MNTLGKINAVPCIVVNTNTGAKLATHKMSDALALMAKYVKQIESLHDAIINDSIDYTVDIHINCYVDPDGLCHGFCGELFTSYSYFK